MNSNNFQMGHCEDCLMYKCEVKSLKGRIEQLEKEKTEKKYLSLLHQAENLRSLGHKNLACLLYEEILKNLQDKSKETFLLKRIQETKN